MQVKLQCILVCYSLLITYVYCGDLSNDDSKSFQNVSVPETNAENSTDTNVVDTTINSPQDYKKLTKKRCGRNYNLNCLKIDLISSVENLKKNTNFQILPGINLISNSPESSADQRASDTKMVFTADNIGNQLNELLFQKILNYARSLSINVQIFDKNEKKSKSFGSSAIDDLIRSYYTVEGRADKKTGKWGSTILTAAVLTGGTLLWMGLSSLMAMATKALAASLLSIIISCITAYKSSGHNSHQKSTTTYEIVAKPVYSHPYSAELQHDPHSAATGHQYGRNMEWDKMGSMSSRSEIQVPIREDAHQLAYKAHVRPIF